LMVLDQDVARVKELIKSDATCKSYYAQLRASADKLLSEPVSQRVLIGPRLTPSGRGMNCSPPRSSRIGILHISSMWRR
jgi:hypothetical protein